MSAYPPYLKKIYILFVVCLKACYDYINEGLKIRPTASYYESEERDTRYFTQLMKSNHKTVVDRRKKDKFGSKGNTKTQMF